MYIDAKRFEELIALHKKKSKKKNDDELVGMFYLLATRIIKKWRFKCDREELIQCSVIVCWNKIEKFDASRGGAFNFFTTIILNEMRHLYRTEYNFNEIRYKLLDKMIKDAGLNKDEIKRYRDDSDYKKRKF